MKFESILTALVCLAVVLLLKGLDTPTPARAAPPVDVNCVAGPLEVATPPAAEPSDCANGFCRRPTLAPQRMKRQAGRQAAAEISPSYERSIVSKRTRAPRVLKRGFFRKIFRRR